MPAVVQGGAVFAEEGEGTFLNFTRKGPLK